MTARADFKAALLRQITPERYPWTANPESLARYMEAVDATLAGSRKCAIDGEAWRLAWKACGMKGRPTYKALHALPAE